MGYVLFVFEAGTSRRPRLRFLFGRRVVSFVNLRPVGCISGTRDGTDEGYLLWISGCLVFSLIGSIAGLASIVVDVHRILGCPMCQRSLLVGDAGGVEPTYRFLGVGPPTLPAPCLGVLGFGVVGVLTAGPRLRVRRAADRVVIVEGC